MENEKNSLVYQHFPRRGTLCLYNNPNTPANVATIAFLLYPIPSFVELHTVVASQLVQSSNLSALQTTLRMKYVSSYRLQYQKAGS